MMEDRFLHYFAVTLSMLVAVVQAQPMDPIINMCVRFDHQSTIKNNTLYIDGGTQTYVPIVNGTQDTGNIAIGYNSALVEIDMSSSWDWRSNISESYINKTDIPNVESIPVLSRGALFAGQEDDENIYLYGGTTNYINTSNPGFEAPTSDEYSLFSWDTNTRNVAQFDIQPGAIWRPSAGAYAEAIDLGLGFYLEGQLNSGSSTETQVLGDNGFQFLNGMIVLDLNAKTAMNISTAPVGTGSPRIYGFLQYIPDVGEKGILVSMGGNDNNGNLLGLDSVDVFNINSLFNNDTGSWVKQNTSGDIPGARVSGCIVMVSAQDNSSHNIYIYGGRGADNEFFDQVYILSIPSFVWTMVYEGSSPRFAHTCHLVGKRQMLTVGGVSDVPLGQGPCDYQTKGVNIFDMSALEFGSVYDANAPPYTVPTPVLLKIGGTPTGGSNVSYPDSFKTLFSKTSPSNTSAPLPTPPPIPPPIPSSPNHEAAVAGAVIGTLLAILFILFSLWYFLYQRLALLRRQRATAEAPPPLPEKDPFYYGRRNELPDGNRYGQEMDGEREAVELYQPPVELSS